MQQAQLLKYAALFLIMTFSHCFLLSPDFKMFSLLLKYSILLMAKLTADRPFLSQAECRPLLSYFHNEARRGCCLCELQGMCKN